MTAIVLHCSTGVLQCTSIPISHHRCEQMHPFVHAIDIDMQYSTQFSKALHSTDAAGSPAERQ